MQKETEIKRWSGSITLPDYLSWPQLMKWDGVLRATDKYREGDKIKSEYVMQFFNDLLPCILDVVQEWHIEGLPERPTVDTFPGSPELVAFLAEQLVELYRKTNEVDPN